MTGLALALRTYGVPGQILTDNGKVFTGRFNQPPVEVLFDRVCRENGIEHLPPSRGRRPRRGRWSGSTARCVPSSAPTGSSPTCATAQAELDEWVHDYNHDRPHQALDMATPADAVPHRHDAAGTPVTPAADHHRGPAAPTAGRSDGTWVARRASAVGVVCVQLAAGLPRRRRRGRPIDVWVTDQVLQFYDGDQLLRTQKRDQHRGGESQADPKRHNDVLQSTTSVTDQPN